MSSYVSAGGPGYDFIEISAQIVGVTHFKYAYEVYGGHASNRSDGSIVIPSLALLIFNIIYVVHLNRK